MPEQLPGSLHQALDRFRNILPPEEIDKLIAIQDEPLPTGIRLNRLKCDLVTAMHDLRIRYGWEVAPIPFYDGAWTIHAARQSPGTTIEHRLGQYYIQDAASMVPVSLFTLPEHPLLILDLTASPGGKTTQLIDLTGDHAFVVANDSSQSRISALRSVLANWGGVNQIITSFPGEYFGEWFPEVFDIILLDAPCSMENLRPMPHRPARTTTTDERLRLQDRQIQLLKSALQALKVGGQLVYSTCSLAPEEDEAVLDTVINTYPGAVSILAPPIQFPGDVRGLTTYGELSFHPSLQHSLRLWPHRTGMSGFFAALLTKTESIPGEQTAPPDRDFESTGLRALSTPNMERVFEKWMSAFGFDLERVLNDFDLVLLQRFDQLNLIPAPYLNRFRGLPYEWIGMPIARRWPDDLEPTPAFISRFGQSFQHGIIQIQDALVPQWIAGRDIRQPETNLTATGQYLLVKDEAGRNLGMGKLLPRRLRNMLPRRSI